MSRRSLSRSSGLSWWGKIGVGLGAAAIGVLIAWFAYWLVFSEARTNPAVLSGKGPPDYQFSIYGVTQPMGMAVYPANEWIYVTENGSDRVIRVFNTEGDQILVLVPPDTLQVERSPSYVAVSAAGTAYVSDRLRHTIDKYDANGDYLGIFTPRDESILSWSPLGLGFDSAGNLYVTEVSTRSHRVMLFSVTGELRLEFGTGGSGPGTFSFPNDTAVDSNGQIYVADSGNFRIQAFDSQGQLQGVFSGEGVGFPRGIEVDGDYLYQVDTFGHTVRVYDLTRGMKPVFSFGEWGVGDGQFNFPNGLALDFAGHIYIADRDNNRIQVWRH